MKLVYVFNIAKMAYFINFIIYDQRLLSNKKTSSK